jgi:hypothetical protein
LLQRGNFSIVSAGAEFVKPCLFPAWKPPHLTWFQLSLGKLNLK